ncbi:MULTISPECIES: hypothetical protein [unclassified Herbaspirillum]|uniref:hypothetical protein n=1 Tax=unclassified Herbaspirillum TaxID=2624150 RepID=UPI00383B2118
MTFTINGLRTATLAIAAALLLAACAGCNSAPEPVQVGGVVWQPDNATIAPRGNWDRLGASELLVQWTAVDGTAFVPGSAMPTAAKLPDWERIAREPWARDVIVGLAGRFDEKAARADIEQLAADSARLAALPTPLHVTGWYFPVEIDPTWQEAPRLAALLAKLPRPLWITVYDSANVGPDALADGLLKWLPPDVGVFFQDGVGVYAREPRVALHYIEVLSKRLGQARVRVIAEMFRPLPGGGFRSATAEEIRPQLHTYHGYRVSLFDGPHYLPDRLVEQLRRP